MENVKAKHGSEEMLLHEKKKTYTCLVCTFKRDDAKRTVVKEIPI